MLISQHADEVAAGNEASKAITPATGNRDVVAGRGLSSDNAAFSHTRELRVDAANVNGTLEAGVIGIGQAAEAIPDDDEVLTYGNAGALLTRSLAYVESPGSSIPVFSALGTAGPVQEKRIGSITLGIFFGWFGYRSNSRISDQRPEILTAI